MVSEDTNGSFAHGDGLLAGAASTGDSRLFNYLQAARAAHLQGRNERRDDWLKLAYQEIPEAANAVLLTQAEFQLDQGQHEQAQGQLHIPCQFIGINQGNQVVLDESACIAAFIRRQAKFLFHGRQRANPVSPLDSHPPEHRRQMDKSSPWPTEN